MFDVKTTILNLFSPRVIGIYTWAWITSIVASIYSIILGVFMTCTFQETLSVIPEFLGCSTSTNKYLYLVFIFIAFGGAGLAGFMGTTIGGKVRDGAMAGALSLSVSTFTEVIIGYIKSLDFSEFLIPLYCNIPGALIVAGLVGALLGSIAGNIQILFERRKERKILPVIKNLQITDNGFVVRGQKVTFTVSVEDPHNYQGIRLYVDGKLWVEQHKVEYPISVETENLLPSKYLIRVEVATLNDLDWNCPSAQEAFLIILPQDRKLSRE